MDLAHQPFICSPSFLRASAALASPCSAAFRYQFFQEDLKSLSEKQRVQIFEEMECSLKDELWDGSQWVADYQRLRVIASK